MRGSIRLLHYMFQGTLFNGVQRPSGLHQFYGEICKVTEQLATVISAINHSGYCASPWLLFKNATLYTHSVFMCFVQNLEQTGGISIHSSKLLDFTTRTAWF